MKKNKIQLDATQSPMNWLEMVTIPQALKAIPCSKRMLHYYQATGKLPFYKCGSSTRFLPSDIQALIKN